MVNKAGEHKTLVFVGDGRSDFCAASAADVVFAKDTLLKHLNTIGRPCIPYQHLKTVYQYLKEAVDVSAQ